MGKKKKEKNQIQSGGEDNQSFNASKASFKTSNIIYWQALTIFIFSILLYANTIGHDYAVDDMIVIQKNKLTQQGIAGIGKIMTTDAFYGFFGEDYKFVAGGRYRPLSIVTFAVEKEIFGSNQPHISHFVNAFLYGITCVVIYFLGFQFFRQVPYSIYGINLPLIIALLFAAHPIHTEVVANIKGRDEIMGMLFSVLSLWAALRFAASQQKYFLIGSLFALVLALFSKENAITFLAVVPLSFYFFTKSSAKTYLLQFIPMLLISGIYVLLRQKFTGVEITADTKEILNNPFVNATYAEQLATVAFTFWEYIRLLIFPHPLTHDYYFNQVPILNWASPKAILSFLLNAAILIWAFMKAKEKNVFSYAILYYFTTLSIVSNILFTVGIAMNERFVFMPSLGFAIILALLIIKTVNYFKIKKFNENQIQFPKAVWIVLILLLSGYSAKTFIRNIDWKNDFTLFAADYENSPNSAKIRNSYGGALFTESEKINEPLKTQYLKKAEVVLAEALKIYPNYLNALLLMGNTKYKLYDSLPEAKYYYDKTIQMRPDYFEGNYNLGCVLIAKGLAKESIPYFRRALIKGADKYEVLFNLADAYFKTQEPDSAIYFYQKSLEKKPNLAFAYYKIGLCYARYKNDYKNGFAFLEKAIALDPKNHVFYEDLGVAHGMNGNYSKAIEYFEKGIIVKPDFKPFYNNLGITYRQMGNEAKANEYFVKAQSMP